MHQTFIYNNKNKIDTRLFEIIDFIIFRFEKIKRIK